MLIVSAKINVAPGKRAAFIREAQPCIAATRKEEGCFFYELYASTDHPDNLMYFEKWQDKTALDKHMASQHMADFAAVKKSQNLQIGTSEVTLFTIAD